MPMQVSPLPQRTSNPLKSPDFKPNISIRLAHLHESPALGRLAARTYCDTPLTAYLSPHRHTYPSDFARGFIQRSWTRSLDPRTLTFVALSSSAPHSPIGYTVIKRLGDDAFARRQIAQRETLGLKVARWIFAIYAAVLLWIVGRDRSSDAERQREFEATQGPMQDEYWVGREERWHVVSCVVDPAWQGRGVGKKLMAEVIARAEEEGVVVGLEASGPGELLYRRVGFELLGRFPGEFELQLEGEEGEKRQVGGIMMYTPVKRRVQA